MSFHKGCVSNYFPNYNGQFKINNQSIDYMTPNRIPIEENKIEFLNQF